MAEVRYIFWDGIPNVKPDGTIENQSTALNKKTSEGKKKSAMAIKRSEPKIKGKNVVAFSEPGVKIISVDDWFVPAYDLLAIKLEINSFPSIKSFMLRIYCCESEKSEVGYKINSGKNQTGSDHFTRLVYQTILYSNELDKLPKNDISIKEDKAKKDERSNKKNEDPLPCYSHCKVVAWVSNLRDEFNMVDGKVELTEVNLLPDFIRIKNNQMKVGFGVDESMAGCKFIEDIMENNTSLKIFDKEPTDSSWIGNKEQKGIGTSFPKFKSQFREGLYHICAKSKIAMALIRAIANEKENKSVSIFPADTVYYSIGGCAVGNYKFTPAGGQAENVNIKDDYSAHINIEKIKNEIKAGNLRQSDDPNWLPGNVWDPNYEYEEGPLDFAAKRYVFSQIGASSEGKGCQSRFYFNEKTINMLLDDTYRVVHHEKIKSHDVLLNGRDQVINVAAAVKDSKGIEQTIETPFFLALAHEMIHARRMQMGLNAEWDSIIEPDNWDGILRHPSSMIAQIRAKVGVNGLTKENVQNLMSRYAPYNREEWDTIEGGGAPVILEQKIFDDFVAKGVIDKNDKTNNANEVRVTENLIRKELKLNFRFRYVDNPTTHADPPKVDSDSELDKKISTPRKLIPGIQTPDIGANIAEKIHSEIINLIEKDGGMKHRDLVVLKPENNYFVRKSGRFSLAKRFKSTAKLPQNEAQWDKSDEAFVVGVFNDIVRNESQTGSLSIQGRQSINDLKNAKPAGRIEDSPKANWVNEPFLKEANTIDSADIQIIINNSNGRLSPGQQIKLNNPNANENDKALIFDALLRDEQGLKQALSASGRSKAAITRIPQKEVSDNDKAAWIDSLIAIGVNFSQADYEIIIQNSENKLKWQNGFKPKLGNWNLDKKKNAYVGIYMHDAEIKGNLSPNGLQAYNQLQYPAGTVPNPEKAEWVDNIVKETFDSIDFQPIADRSGGGIVVAVSLEITAQNPDIAAKAQVYDSLLAGKENILGTVSANGKAKLESIFNRVPSPTFTLREKADHVLRFLQKAFWLSDNDLSQILGNYPKVEEARTADAGVDCFAGYNMDPQIAPVDNNLGHEPNPASRAAAFMHVRWANEPIENVRHALVHEPMHMFSAGGTGFNDWQIDAGVNGAAIKQLMENIPGGTSKERLINLKSVLDEGATEMFARIVCYRVNDAENDRILVINRLEGLPYYEWPVHLVCQIVRDLKQLKGNDVVGFQIMAKAFYDGKWDALNDAFFELKGKSAKYNKRYSPEFWQYASDLVIGNEPFKKRDSVPSNAVEKFRTEFGIYMLHGDEVKSALDDGSYRDPVCFKYYPGPDYRPEPVISDKMKVCCEKKVNKAETKGQQDNKPVKKISVCINCKQRINVPVKTIMKN